MKNLFAIVVLSLFASSAFAARGLPLPAEVRARLNSPGWENYRSAQVGTQVVDKKTQLMRAKFDYATQGDSTTAAVEYVLKDVDGKDAVLPKGAIITKAIIDVLTTASPTTTDLSVEVESSDDIKAAATWANSLGIVAGIPDGDAANMIKTTTDKSVKFKSGSGGLTAGKLDVFIEYIVTE